MPCAAASPVPRWAGCSTNTTLAHPGACSWTFFVTLLRTVADDQRGALGMHQLEGMDDVEHHRPPADHVQRLGAVRAHAGPLARRQHDG